MTLIVNPRNCEWADPTFDEALQRINRATTSGCVIIHHGDPVTFWDGERWTVDWRRARRYLGDATACDIADVLQDGEVTVERIVW